MTHAELTKLLKLLKKSGVTEFQDGPIVIKLSSAVVEAASPKPRRQHFEQKKLQETIPEDMLLNWSSTPVGA